MASNNFSPINDLIKKSQPSSVSPHKEAEPITKPAEVTVKEAVEHRPEEEVKPFVKTRAETIKLPPDLTKMGVRTTPTTKFPTFEEVYLPLSDDKILSGLHAPTTSSLRWLATLAWYILRKAHLTLKKVHGHVIRVTKK